MNDICHIQLENLRLSFVYIIVGDWERRRNKTSKPVFTVCEGYPTSDFLGLTFLENISHERKTGETKEI